MEGAIAKTTEWIEQTWPDLPQSLLRERTHVVDMYLAFLATRQRRFMAALKFLGRGLMAQPSRLCSSAFVDAITLLLAHTIGLRVYRWDFWKKPALEAFFCVPD
jgi:hypothetical protein